MDFDPNDPFPLLAPGSFTYQQAKLHAEKVDQWLGMDTVKVEAEVAANPAYPRLHQEEGQRLWVGLPVQTLLTPYLEIRTMLEDLAPAPGTTLVDLGAGYGRIGFVLTRHFPEVEFIGYEFVKERVEEGARALARFGVQRAQLLQADLFARDFSLPGARYFFLYDYGSREAIERTLESMKRVAQGRSVTVVGRGRLTRDLIERGHPWLSQVNPSRHRGNYSIYST